MFGQKYDPNKPATSGGGDKWIKRFPKDKPMMKFRPLVEVDDLTVYFEVWDNGIKRGWPIEEADIATLEEYQEAKRKPLLPILNVDEDQVWAWACPWSVVELLTARAKIKGTITDADFICVKEGSGIDSSYNTIEDRQFDRPMDKYETIDVEKVLQTAHQRAVDEGWCEGTKSPTEAAPANVDTTTGEVEAPAAEVPKPETVSGSTVPTGDLTEGLPDGWENHTIAKIRTYARAKGISPSGLSKGEMIAAIKGEDAL